MKEEILFQFDVIAQLRVNEKVEFRGATVALVPGFNKERYIEKETGRLLNPGIKAVTNTLIQALLCNLHDAHQRGLYDSTEHYRQILSELEKGFAQPAWIVEDNWKLNKK